MILIFAENSSCSPSKKPLELAAKALGWSIFDAKGWTVPPENNADFGAIYGGRLFVSQAADTMKWDVQEPNEEWLSTIPMEYVHRKIEILSYKEAKNLKSPFFASSLNQEFTSGVFQSGINLPKYYNTPPENKILISEVMNFTSKYRCFIKNNIVVSASCYLYNDPAKRFENRPHHFLHSRNHDKVVEFATKVIANSPPVNCDGYVLDIARYEKEKNDWPFVVLDIKPAWYSELYGCEVSAALDTMAASFKPMKDIRSS